LISPQQKGSKSATQSHRTRVKRFSEVANDAPKHSTLMTSNGTHRTVIDSTLGRIDSTLMTSEKPEKVLQEQ